MRVSKALKRRAEKTARKTGQTVDQCIRAILDKRTRKFNHRAEQILAHELGKRLQAKHEVAATIVKWCFSCSAQAGTDGCIC